MKDGNVLSAISRAADIEESRILIFDTIDSTNSEARRLAQNGAGAPFLIIARGQSAGRGRMGRSFYSPEGTGLLRTNEGSSSRICRFLISDIFALSCMDMLRLSMASTRRLSTSGFFQ